MESAGEEGPQHEFERVLAGSDEQFLGPVIEHAAAVEEAIWGRMHFATHLRARRLGEFTIGTELHRSESLALVQLLILYHLVTVKAALALGGQGMRSSAEELRVPEPELAP